MRRLILLFSAALLAAWVFSQPATAVIGHSASGTGTSTQNDGSSFDFTATGGPGATGGGATGSMTYNEVFGGGSTVQAQVRCLFVSGNRATIVGVIVASTFTSGIAVVGNQMIFYVEDNGTPGARIDEWSVHFGAAVDVTDCRQFVDLANPILTGEIVVSEGVPPPPPPCPPGDDDGDDDGLTDDRESLFGALLDDFDSDDDGVSDGNEDSDDDDEDDEDEDDDEDTCPDDSDGDGTDDEDEDD
jgi:hypothetical protein